MSSLLGKAIDVAAELEGTDIVVTGPALDRKLTTGEPCLVNWLSILSMCDKGLRFFDIYSNPPPSPLSRSGSALRTTGSL